MHIYSAIIINAFSEQTKALVQNIIISAANIPFPFRIAIRHLGRGVTCIWHIYANTNLPEAQLGHKFAFNLDNGNWISKRVQIRLHALGMKIERN